LGIAFLLQAVLSYGRWDIILPRRIMLWGSALILISGPVWRILYTGAVWQAMGAQKVLLVGVSPVVREVVERMRERPQFGMIPIGFLDDEEKAAEIAGVANLGPLHELTTAVDEHKPHRLIVGISEERRRLPLQQLVELRFAGMHIENASLTFETILHRVSVRELKPAQLVFSADLGPNTGMLAMQVVYSWLIAFFLLVLALPVMLVVALLVRLTSRGPVLYRQLRTGKDGVPFWLYKFRSMRHDAEAGTGAVWATKDDPRVTALGRWLRKLRLDELPQLFNVIRGEMSLVGPRPERPEFVRVLQEKIPYYRHRLSVKPGITGWAQVNHKYGDTIEDTIIKLEYDLYYIKYLTPSLDAFILFHTFKTVLLGRGAQ
jgi:exopolysaccharide biosynthesis polyprenyl glycosylphosphotransferase